MGNGVGQDKAGLQHLVLNKGSLKGKKTRYRFFSMCLLSWVQWEGLPLFIVFLLLRKLVSLNERVFTFPVLMFVLLAQQPQR